MAVNTKDKYYTPEWLVKHTVKKAVEIIGKENITDIIEPSAGDGAFIEELDKLAKELGINVEYYDLYPSHPRIIKMDYKKLIKSYKKGRLIIGNPPFGTSSSLWKAFCKKSAKIGDFIAFISPASQYKSNYYFKEGVLVYSELLNDVEYRGDEEYGGKDQKVRTCLNIYKVYDREEEEDWRIKRLEQDIQIVGLDSRDPLMNEKLHNYDWYLDRFKTIGKPSQTPRGDCFAIKILNENVRSKVDKVMNEFDTKYRNDICRLSNGTPVLSIFKLRDILITNLYPTREERLEQDVQLTILEKRKYYTDPSIGFIEIDNHKYVVGDHGKYGLYEHNQNDIIIDQYYSRGKIIDVNELTKSSNYLLRCRDGLVKERVMTLLKSECFKTFVDTQYEKLEYRIDGNDFRAFLIKHLYPTREERLEQDVLITKEGADFYFGTWGAGPICKVINELNGKCGYIGIKIFNESKRQEIENFFQTHYDRNEIIRKSTSAPQLSMHKIKEDLIKHLYPTREERLEQDVRIELDHTNRIFEYHISQLGDAGRTTKERIAASSYGITILNESIRVKFEQSFDLIKQLIQKHPLLSIASGGSMSINKHAVKEVLMNVLYPQDNPQFEGYDYPEVRKPVHVERAVHGKPLIPIEYREEIVKTPKEETKVAAVALF